MKYLVPFLALVVIALSGCATYEEPPASATSCSVTVRKPEIERHRLIVTSIDSATADWHVNQPSNFVVSPGPHVFKINYGTGFKYGLTKIEITFEPSHSYTLLSSSDGNTYDVWFVDDATHMRLDQKSSTDWGKFLFGKLAE